MDAIVETWLLRMKTPVGTTEADYRFDEGDGVIHDTASGSGEITPRAGRLPRTRVAGERASA
jgi:hypothetical protein